MGVRREVYQALGGFSNMRFGEDIDFSIRIFKGGYQCRLFPGAWVYHKRRTDFKKFFKQVHNSGIARINLYKKYPESLKVVHLLPAVFTLGVALLLLCTPFCLFSLVPILLYALLVCLDSARKTKAYASASIPSLLLSSNLSDTAQDSGVPGGNAVYWEGTNLRLSARTSINKDASTKPYPAKHIKS